MKIDLKKYHDNHWCYNIDELDYTQEEYDYAFKFLDFDKLFKDCIIYFNNEEIRKLFYETYINSHYLNNIYNQSYEGYKWLKNNWGKGKFKLWADCSDKQKLKTIVNRIINVELIRKK